MLAPTATTRVTAVPNKKKEVVRGPGQEHIHGPITSTLKMHQPGPKTYGPQVSDAGVEAVADVGGAAADAGDAAADAGGAGGRGVAHADEGAYDDCPRFRPLRLQAVIPVPHLHRRWYLDHRRRRRPPRR
jgi:hypothetical protein